MRATVNAVAIAIVAFTWALASRYYATHLPIGDVARNVSIVLRSGELADAAGFVKALTFAAGEDIYVLHSLVSVFLHPVLPKSLAMSPLLNAVWYLIAVNILFTLFLKETRSAVAAALLPLPPLLFLTAMSTPRFGFTGIDVNLLAYLLACGIVPALILSEQLTHRRWAAVAGLLFGSLVLGRFQSAVLVGIAVGPMFLAALVPARTRRDAVIGIGVFCAAALVVCGPWLVAGGIQKHYAYYRDMANIPGGSFEASYLGAFRLWARTVDDWLRANLATALCWLLLSWVAAREVLSGERTWGLVRRIDWLRLWLFAGPMAALALTKAGQHAYAFPAYCGLYLFATRPFGRVSVSAPSAFENRRLQALFGVAVAALLASYVLYTPAAHASPGIDRQETQALLRPLLDDPRCKEPRAELRVTVTYYNGLTDHNVINSLLVDFDQQAVQADRPPARTVALPGRCVFNVLLDTHMVRQPDWGTADAAVNERMVGTLPKSADYALVLSPDTTIDPSELTSAKYYVHWMDLSRRLLASGCWDAVGPARTINPWERALLLRRSCG